MPLAHILAPQLARRAEEIAAATGHPSPSAGYLQTVGAGSGPKPIEYDPRFSAMGSAIDAAGAMPGATVTKLPGGHTKTTPGPMGRAFLGALDQPHDPNTHLLPNAPVQSAPPIDTSKKIAKKGTPMTIKLGEGAVGMDEAGRAVDKKGRKLGYLASQTAPGRDLALRREDVTPGFNPLARSQFGAKVLAEGFAKTMPQYQQELEDYKYNGYKWPKGYFDGVDPRIAKETRAIVENFVSSQMDVGPNKKPLVY